VILARATAAVLVLCAIAAPAAAKPRRFRPAAMYAGLFQPHHAWRYRVDFTDPDGHSEHHIVRCAVAKVMSSATAVMSRVACTHGDWDLLVYDGARAFNERPVPDGVWYADADGLRVVDAALPSVIPGPDAPGELYTVAAPVEISHPGDEPDVSARSVRRTRDGWCFGGPGEVMDGGMTNDITLCYGASAVPEVEVTTTNPSSHLVVRVVAAR
jgi:hypothetical protein